MDPFSSQPQTTDRIDSLLAALPRARGRERSLLEEEVVAFFLPLAARMAGRYRDRGVEIEDLRQVANVALFGSVRRFDPARGDFVPFAVVTISGEIKKHFRDHAWSVRPPRSIQELQADIRTMAADWVQLHGAEPSDVQVADQLGESCRRIAEARTAQTCFRPTSIDAPSRSGDRPLRDTLVDQHRGQDLVDELVSVGPTCRGLSEDERDLIDLRFFRDLTQQEIGDLLGVSQMQVSRRLAALTRKLRTTIEGPTAA